MTLDKGVDLERRTGQSDEQKYIELGQGSRGLIESPTSSSSPGPLTTSCLPLVQAYFTASL